MKNWLAGMITLSVLSACGPSEAEIARNARQELLRQQEYTRVQESLKRQLIELKSRLSGENARMEGVEEFHLFRTDDEKAQQVENQTMVIEELKVQIADVEKQIDN